MANSKSKSFKFYRVLHIFVQTIIVILLLALIVIWSLLLIDISLNRDFFISSRNQNYINVPVITSLISINRSDEEIRKPTNRTSHSLTASAAPAATASDDVSICVFSITNVAIPELFAVLALFSVVVANIYGCTVFGVILFVFWILEHRRYPTLLAFKTKLSTIEILTVAGHGLHLVAWTLLLAYGWFLFTTIRFSCGKRSDKSLQSNEVPHIVAENRNYCGYLSPSGQSMPTADMSPYYEHGQRFPPPPPPTFETIQIGSTRTLPTVR